MPSRVNFGWLKYNPDGSFNTTVEKEPLDEGQVEEVERFLRFLAKNRITLIEYLVCSSNFQDCLNLPDKLTEIAFREKEILTFSTTVGVEMYTIIDKHTSSFISACSSFRDRLLKREGIKKDSNHPLVSTISMIYDSSFEYRLFYNLRNVGLHQESIFQHLPVTGDWVEKDKFKVDLGMKAHALSDALAKGQGQKRVRDELKSFSGEIEFIDAARKHLFHMKNIFLVYLLSQRDELQHFVHFYAALKSGIRGAPEDATLLLFNDFAPASEQMADGSFKQDVKITHISMDEAEFYVKLFPELNMVTKPSE